MYADKYLKMYDKNATMFLLIEIHLFKDFSFNFK